MLYPMSLMGSSLAAPSASPQSQIGERANHQSQSRPSPGLAQMGTLLLCRTGLPANSIWLPPPHLPSRTCAASLWLSLSSPVLMVLGIQRPWPCPWSLALPELHDRETQAQSAPWAPRSPVQTDAATAGPAQG